MVATEPDHTPVHHIFEEGLQLLLVGNHTEPIQVDIQDHVALEVLLALENVLIVCFNYLFLVAFVLLV